MAVCDGERTGKHAKATRGLVASIFMLALTKTNDRTQGLISTSA